MPLYSQFISSATRFQDRGAPSTEVKSFHGINFKAILAVDDPEAKDLIAQPGSDGFRMSARPLFQVYISLSVSNHVALSALL